MPKFRPQPCALTVAGSDSGGGAGLQADLRTFLTLGVHGVSALTCLTAQNPREVRAIRPVPPSFVRQQLEAIFDELPPLAAKTGMLFSAGVIREVARFFGTGLRPPLVVDPVMVATSGAVLLQKAAIRALCDELIPEAVLITPNLDEAALLVEHPLRSVEDLRSASRTLHARFGCAALVKGGHLTGLKQAVDVFYNGKTELLLEAPFIRGVSTHGTGCTYSAAIVAGLARGRTLVDAVEAAKGYITRAIADSRRVGAHSVLGWSEKAALS